ncbi:MAG: class I SAM-dependent methyltransferase [Dehalococcoidia bacterium]|nr:MAG: class I SAM-dependent methyltransferase [Dehalococcoidia bacterium]
MNLQSCGYPERLISKDAPSDIWLLHLERYIFAKRFVQKNTILDVSCGTGYGAKLLSEYAKEVVGGDISSDAISYAKKIHVRKNLSFIVLDAHQFPFGESTIDSIVSFETIEHLSSPSDFISESVRTLKKNGIFICSTNNRGVLTPNWKSPLNPFHKKEFTLNEFAGLFKQYFNKVDLYGVLFLGPFQRFVSMFQHTLGFLLVKLKFWSVFGSLQPRITKLINPYFSHDFIPRKLSSNINHSPGYIIAVCSEPK